MKKLGFSVLLFILVLAIFEAFAAVFFSRYHDRFTFKSMDSYIIAQDKIEAVKRQYDFNLGWKHKYPTPFGERPREINYPTSLMATFGDSYTHCDQVKDNETWQTYLSRMITKNVFNFGTGAYGTDQTYLRFREDYPKVKTPIVTLGLITADINRMVNVYRPFFAPKTGMPGTKPRYIVKGDSLVLLENPIKSSNEIHKLRDADFLKKIGENDYWYKRNDLPECKFPYSRILFNRHFWAEVKAYAHKQKIDDISPRQVNLWDDPVAVELMFKIFDAFEKDAHQHGAIPIIMILPVKSEVQETFTTGKAPGNVQAVLNYCREKNYLVYNGNDALAKEAKNVKDIDAYFIDHASAKGNELVAKSLFLFLKDNNLL